MKVKICSAHGYRCGIARVNAEAWADLYRGPCCVTEWSTSHERAGVLSRESVSRREPSVPSWASASWPQARHLFDTFCSVLFWKWQLLSRQVFKLRNVSIGWCSSSRLEHVGPSGESVCVSPDNHWGKIIFKCCFLGALVALQILPFSGYWPWRLKAHLSRLLIPKADGRKNRKRRKLLNVITDVCNPSA